VFVCYVTAGVCVDLCLFVCCMTAGDLCEFVCCVTAGFLCVCLFYWLDLRHSLMFHVLSAWYVLHFNRNVELRHIISLYCKESFWGEETPYSPRHKISQQFPCHITVAAKACVPAWTVIFVLRDAKHLATDMVLSRYFQFPCQYPYTNATYSHHESGQRYIISKFCNLCNKIPV
jgi:hypothetical protein